MLETHTQQQRHEGMVGISTNHMSKCLPSAEDNINHSIALAWSP